MLELVSPWTFAALAASVIAFYTSARSLQIGPGVEVIALTSVAANLVHGGGKRRERPRADQLERPASNRVGSRLDSSSEEWP